MDEDKNPITAMPPTYRNSRHKLKDSLKNLRSLPRSTSPKPVLTKTRSRPKLKLVGRRCPYKTLRLRSCLDKSPYLPPKIKIVKEEQKISQEEAINKRIDEELDDDTEQHAMGPQAGSCRVRTPPGSGGGGRARAASRRRVGCVLEPPTPADALRRRQWPVSGMHERPEWPRAGASRSPTPPPHDAAAAAADAARRSVHCALHAALAFGAQACQDIKEEMEAKNNKKLLNHDKTTHFPHVFEQYLRTCHQDREYICKQKCGTNTSEVYSSNWDNGSDKDSEPLDLSDGSAECDSYDFPESSEKSSMSNFETHIQNNNNLLQNDSPSQSNTTQNVSLVTSMPPRKPPFISTLCSNTNLSSQGSYPNTRSANACDVQQKSCDIKHMDDRNVFLVTGHFDTSNTFCITSSTKCDQLDDNKKSVDVSKQISVHSRSSSSNVQISKINPLSNIVLDKKNCDSKLSHIVIDKSPENFPHTTNFSPSSMKCPNPPFSGSSSLSSSSEATNLNKSLQIQEITIHLNSLEDSLQASSCEKIDMCVKNNKETKPMEVHSNPELVIIPISEEKSLESISDNSNNTNASPESVSKLPIFIENIDQGNKKGRHSILKIPTSISQINVDENVSRCTSKTKCTFGDSIECIKKRFVCTSNTIISKEMSNDSTSTTCVPYFPTTSEETECSRSNSQNGTKETNLLKTNIIVEEGDKFLHLFRVSKIEESFSEIAREREISIEDKQEKNSQHRWKSTLMPKKTLLPTSTSEQNGRNTSKNSNQCNKPNKRESKTNIMQDMSGKKHICNSSSSTFSQVLDKTSSRNSGSLLERTSNNNFSFKRKEDTIIETLVPVIFHRALHYCMICNASPQDLASYIDTLSPLSIMNWPE